MKFNVYTLSLKSQLQPTYCKIVISFQITMHFSTAIYMNCTTLWWRLISNFMIYLPARSLDDFMSLTNATRKNPHEWRTPLTNALLNNNEKQTRKARQLSFVNPCASFSVLFDSSSSHRRAFSFFAILKKNVVRCFMFQRQTMTFPPWQRNNFNVINVTTYAKLKTMKYM